MKQFFGFRNNFLLPALVIIFIFSIFSLPVRGQQLEYYGIESSLNDDMTAKTVLTIRFAEPVNNSEFRLDYKAFNMSAKADFDSADCQLSSEGDKSKITCSLSGITKDKNLLTLTFYTKDGITTFQNRYNFSSNYRISVPAKESFILIKIPKNSVLSEDPANQSYAPRDGKILSDGKYIMVYWQRENLTANDDMRFSVSYAIQVLSMAYNNIMVISVAGIVIISMISVAIYMRRGYGPGKITAEVVASVLNNDEKRVVDILARHGGKSGQKIIVRESDFSKAKVSRLVKNLKNRGVVDIEPISGRENRIILKFEKKSGPEQKPEEQPSENIAENLGPQ